MPGPTPRRIARFGAAGVLFLVALVGSVASAHAQENSPLAPLIERITTGDADEAAEATDELVERLAGPLGDALGVIGQRPPDEQRRLRAALERLTCVVRLRLCRAGLPSAEVTLLDEFTARNRDLVERLFHDDPRERRAALLQIPLEPNSAAGVLVVAKFSDWDPEVSEVAAGVAATLKDAVVARGLTRYVKEATDAVQSGQFGPGEQEIVIAVMDLTHKAIVILGEARATDSVPAIIDAVRCFGRRPYRRLFGLAGAFDALGKIGEERAAPLLMEYLNDGALHAARNVGPATLAQLTVGDAALLALARIYGLPPASLGFYVGSGANPMIGFTDDRFRSAAVQAFANWHAANTGKPRDQRPPLTTQPAPVEEDSSQP